jgi:hypothetical protein
LDQIQTAMKFLYILSAAALSALTVHLHAQPAYDWHHDTYDPVPSRAVAAKTIAAGDSNFVYVAGQSNRGTDFDFGAGIAHLSDTLHANAYVAVYTTTGVYARSWCLEQTTNGFSQVGDMCIAGNGDVLITGYFTGAVDFSPGAASTIIAAGTGPVDSYVARYTKLGQLLWVKTFTPTGTSWVQTLCIKEAVSKVVVGGMFFTAPAGQVDLNPDAGTNNYSTTNCAAGFIVCLSSAGTFEWTIGNLAGSVQGIDMNSSGTIAVTGQVIVQTDFDPGPNAATHTAVCTGPCMGDFFVARYDSSGNYEWHYAVGDWYEGVGFDVRINPADEIYVVGYCGGLIDLDPGPGNTSVNTNGNFCAKYYINGSLAWARNGGSALDIDAAGNTYVLDHSGTHFLSPTGAAIWSIAAGITPYGGSIALSQNAKILMAWESAMTEDMDPGPGTVTVNNPLIAPHAIHLSLQIMPTALAEAGSAHSPTLYPNPASGSITVSACSTQEAYTIVNAAGATVKTGIIVSGQQQISIAELPDGVYFLSTGSAQQPARFVIIH